MVYTHHSHICCTDCGEKHVPNDKDACIEVLKGRISDLEDQIVSAEETITDMENERTME